jgi:hypothetical protein
MAKRGKDIKQMLKEGNPARLGLNLLIIFPIMAFCCLMPFDVSSFIGQYFVVIIVSLMISVGAYAVSLKFRASLYSKLDRVPADTSFFFATAFMIPLLIIFPFISTGNIGVFVSVGEGIIVAASIFALVGAELRDEFPQSDTLSLFLGIIASIIIMSILSMIVLSATSLTILGLLMSYLAIWFLFTLIIYTIQIIAFAEGFDFALISPFSSPKKRG